MMEDPLIDDTAICPACDSSGSGVADTSCGFCGGGGGVPLSVAQDFENKRRIMTAPPKFGDAIAWGDAIPVDGIRPYWLPDDVDTSFKSGSTWTLAAYSPSDFHWPIITAIRLEVPRYDFVYLALERGVVPWFGGDEAPGDWDENKFVLQRNGQTRLCGSRLSMFWANDDGFDDIIGYTRKATSTALPLAHPAAPQGEEKPFSVRETLAAMLLEHDAGGITMRTLREAREHLSHPATTQGEDERLRTAVEEAIYWLKSAPLESGYCCCGSPVDSHGMGDGHSPVDELSYSACQLQEQLTAALAPAAIASGREGAE